MARNLRRGSRVKWRVDHRWVHGKVLVRYTQDVTHIIDGIPVTRVATPSNPVFLIVQDDGREVLKSKSELERDY